jgi:hypothetical protein
MSVFVGKNWNFNFLLQLAQFNIAKLNLPCCALHTKAYSMFNIHVVYMKLDHQNIVDFNIMGNVYTYK